MVSRSRGRPARNSCTAAPAASMSSVATCTPSCSSEIGDMSALISDEQLGVQVATDDMDAAGAAVQEFLAGLPRDRETIRARARSLAARRYSWSAYTSV